MTTWTLTDLERACRAAWGPDTCDPDASAAWTADNPAYGQCGTTSMVLWNLFGGELVLADVHRGGERTGNHYWNRLPGGIDIDLTRDQFDEDEIVSAGHAVTPPPDAPRRCREEYELLRSRVFATLDLAVAV